MEKKPKRPPLPGILLGLMAAVLGFFFAGQVLLLVFLNAPADVSWEEERRSLIREWLYIFYATPILVFALAPFAMPAVLSVYYFGWTSLLSNIALGTATGLIFSPDFDLLAIPLPYWLQGSVMGAGGGAAFWVALRIYILTALIIQRALGGLKNNER